jgi:ferric-dicitrate binding protein FerR (iron transport regulator)
MQSRLEYLFNCYVERTCSSEEEQELMEILARSENKADAQKLVDKLIEHTQSEIQMPDGAAASILQDILQTDKAPLYTVETEQKVFSLWARIAAAATVILCICGAAFWMLSQQNKEKLTALIAPPQKQNTKILPGGNHAILTMADGSQIVLDSIQDGNISNGTATISKQGGLLVYDGSFSKKNAPIAFNTLITPRGGQYKIVLADGSKVWLNASSSLHFPTSFTGKERDVDLTGEAYFEIAKNKKKPFHVNVNGYRVEVLGTHFDVNAYADEGAIKTSLLQGSVKIKKGNIIGMLKPGQQGVLAKNGTSIEIKKTDMNEVVAWKNGLFQFDGADIKSVMRQIGRWYDVEILYVGKVPDRRFEGKISRDAQLSDVLRILELSNVKFKVQGKKILVQ